jgi:hypothetical protein
VPLPLTSIFPAHVALKVMLADVLVAGVTVYFTAPQLAAGKVDDDVTHVPAKSPTAAEDELGDVGFLPVSLSMTSQPAPSRHAAASAAINRD